MTRAAAVVAAAFLVLLVGASPALAATRNVGIQSSAFRTGNCPAPTGNATITVDVGDTVRWTNCDAATHTVTADDRSFNSGNLDLGETFDHKFTSPGTVAYHCEIHSFMHGSVVVQAITTTAPPTTAPPTTARPATTVTTAPPTTTTTTTTPPTTVTTIDLNGAFGTTTTPDDDSDDGNSNGAIVALLVVLIAGVGGGAAYVIWRMRTPTDRSP